MAKAPIPIENPKSKMSTTPQKKRHQNFDYTAIVGWLRKVNWSRDSYPTAVVKPVTRSQPSYQPHKLCRQKDIHLKIQFLFAFIWYFFMTWPERCLWHLLFGSVWLHVRKSFLSKNDCLKFKWWLKNQTSTRTLSIDLKTSLTTYAQ